MAEILSFRELKKKLEARRKAGRSEHERDLFDLVEKMAEIVDDHNRRLQGLENHLRILLRLMRKLDRSTRRKERPSSEASEE